MVTEILVYRSNQSSLIFLSDGEDDSVPCKICQDDECQCRELLYLFNRTNMELVDMEIFDRICGATITALIQTKIDAHVNLNCTGFFDKSHLSDLEKVNAIHKLR